MIQPPSMQNSAEGDARGCAGRGGGLTGGCSGGYNGRHGVGRFGEKRFYGLKHCFTVELGKSREWRMGLQK